MGDPINVYGAIAWAINLGSVLVLMILQWWFVCRLRRCAPDVYESLGSPTFRNQSCASLFDAFDSCLAQSGGAFRIQPS